MTSFVNPFNFVGLDPATPVKREHPEMHQAVIAQDGGLLFSGRLLCYIAAISPIFIPHRTRGVSTDNLPNGKRHPRFSKFFDLGDDIPVIPGASLKGAIRSVAEALANGCMSTYAEAYPLPSSYTPCSDFRSLCPTCRLFGMSTADQASEEQLFFKGRVSIGDARWTTASAAHTADGGPLYLQEVTLAILSSPRPRHTRFYRRGKFARGRKFYYHRDGLGIVTSDRKSNQNCTVKPLAAGSMFQFEVTYHQLTQAELALLVFALELDPKLRSLATGMPRVDDGKLIFRTNPQGQVVPGVYHKLGYGKPIGLGSAAINIIRWDACDDKARYAAPDPADGGIQRLEGQEMRDQVLNYKRQFLFPDGNPQALPRHVSETMAILRWPNNLRQIRYPNHNNGEFDDYDLPDPLLILHDE